MDLLIQYEASDGQLSHRRISDIEPVGSDTILAYCHLRQEERTFHVSRIRSAVDPETGEVVANLHCVLGLAEPTPSRSPSSAPPVTLEDAKRQRNKEKYELYKQFKVPVIAAQAKACLFALFSNSCFNCGAPDELVIDHHMPQSSGGRLTPGNLVVLCKRCNGLKLDQQPVAYYSPEQLQQLQPLLEAQASIFAFRFDWSAWKQNREAYLLSVGVPADLVQKVLHDESHPLYVGYARQQEGDNERGFVIRVDLANKQFETDA